MPTRAQCVYGSSCCTHIECMLYIDTCIHNIVDIISSTMVVSVASIIFVLHVHTCLWLHYCMVRTKHGKSRRLRIVMENTGNCNIDTIPIFLRSIPWPKWIRLAFSALRLTFGSSIDVWCLMIHC